MHPMQSCKIYSSSLAIYKHPTMLGTLSTQLIFLVRSQKYILWSRHITKMHKKIINYYKTRKKHKVADTRSYRISIPISKIRTQCISTKTRNPKYPTFLARAARSHIWYKRALPRSLNKEVYTLSTFPA